MVGSEPQPGHAHVPSGAWVSSHAATCRRGGLYDVIALPGVVRPMMIGFRNEEIRRTVSIE
jgi:hypothetical protein